MAEIKDIRIHLSNYVEVAVQKQDKEQALTALNFVNKKLDKSLTKGIYQKNYVARQKSRLQKLVNTL